MAPVTQTPATLDDLMKVEGKAELIGGRIVYLMPSGELHGDVAVEILLRLKPYADAHGGKVHGDGVGFALAAPLPSGRMSFCPDMGYSVGPPRPKNTKFVPGPPAFAVEVRSDNDCGPKAEREMAEKRADYFAAGTLVVWDVDPVAETIARYTTADPLVPVTFRRGEIADAEPAVPGWRLPVDDVFA